MARIIIKLTDPSDKKEYYLDWSTHTDAPVSNGFSREDFKQYYLNRYGEHKEGEINAFLDMAAAKGCSAYVFTLDELLRTNRAGDKEKQISLEEILDRYCRNVDDSDHS